MKKILLKTMLLLCALVVGSNAWAEDLTWTHTFSSGQTISSNSITVSGVTWSVSTTSGKGSPSISSGNMSSKYGLKFGSSKDNYYGSVTFSTDYFNSYNVKSVSVKILNNGSKSGTLTAKQNNTTIGSTSQSFGQTWTDLTVNTNSGTGGALSFTYSVQQAFYINSITVTYVSGPTTFSVTYDANGATSGTVPTDATAYTSGATVTVANNTGSLAKTGYAFGGWNTQEDGQGTDRAAGSTFSITGNTTLYAKWNAKTVTGLSYEGTPTTTSYYGGESFDPTGLTVTATFDDSSTEDVTSSVVWTPNPLTTGTTSVTGTYGGQTINVGGLTVSVALGSEERPFTVAEALAYIAAMTGEGNDLVSENSYYTRAFVSEVGSLEEGGCLNYFISDDGTTTNQFQVYMGKYLNEADFTDGNILQVGDEVVVYGKLEKYYGTPYYYDYSMLTYFKRKYDSDLAITSSTPVALEITSTNLHPTSTITWTTSSSGNMSFVSDDESVATVSNEGVITAVSEGSTTIKVTQAADDDYKESSEKSVTVNVTDGRAECGLAYTTTAFNANLGEVFATPALTNPNNLSVTYSSSPASVASVNASTGEVTILKDGTVTITATTEGNNSYKGGSASYTITVTDPNKKVFDFEQGDNDYGSGVTTTSNSSTYVEEEKTWTLDGVTIVTGGKYRWWNNSSGNTLRFYSNKVSNAETTKMTISAPTGKVVTGIAITGGQQFVSNDGVYSSSNGKWAGQAPSVVLTYARSSGSIDVKTVSVTIGNPTVTVGSALFATYKTVIPVSFTGVTAYTVSEVSDETVKLTKVTEAPANTPVIIQASAAGDYELTYKADAASVGTNYLRVSDGTVTGGDNIYALAKMNGTVGFNLVDSSVIIPAGKCYLDTSGSGIKSFLGFEFGEGTTEIEGVENSAVKAPVFYNLAGQRVAQPTRGIYIVNGKKVIIK